MEPLTSCYFYFAGPGLENPNRYRPGGYHPVHLGDVYHERYRVIHKLGFGANSTVWLARDLQQTHQSAIVVTNPNFFVIHSSSQSALATNNPSVV